MTRYSVTASASNADVVIGSAHTVEADSKREARAKIIEKIEKWGYPIPAKEWTIKVEVAK